MGVRIDTKDRSGDGGDEERAKSVQDVDKSIIPQRKRQDNGTTVCGYRDLRNLLP